MLMLSKNLLSVFLLVAFIFAAPLVHAQKAGAYNDMIPDILKYVNEHRKEKGLKPLTNNPVIAAASADHSKNMATGKIPFGHDGFNERMDKLAKQLPPSYSYAENVAEGAPTAKEVV